ncbi:toxin-antitoxin system HicB family antitoxin [Salmonella enterica subsp. enterica]|uniref:Toxin-antitoxin system HicB family antitoxin n=1 Tax=Salmonella enterica subsp. enterica serovar Kintambo TaxID=1192730 RepID=A0A5W7RX34_SALET|nr:toxin-antitoxin system HicB family antitoxin [Salmonella enterica subsp. enterica serovar Kintambo]EBZ5775275.1 toxin-antitoxin system HicB family antitoxin [Salmonella enterica subsp. enterica serovar Redlands]ECQ6566619.1 toxin-antitoxin system HicB family antitoxin [Salmonella enterica subsp. enterica serovar Kintambo]ECV5098619.1 toxin-antitoxin system HicB family antitoxin [Salmonella enterica subsp. enterica serovar Kintambo]
MSSVKPPHRPRVAPLSRPSPHGNLPAPVRSSCLNRVTASHLTQDIPLPKHRGKHLIAAPETLSTKLSHAPVPVPESSAMAKKPLKLSPLTPRPLEVTSTDHQIGSVKPIQIRIDPLLHREIKIAATEQGKTITAFLLECYQFWRRMNR